MYTIKQLGGLMQRRGQGEEFRSLWRRIKALAAASMEAVQARMQQEPGVPGPHGDCHKLYGEPRHMCDKQGWISGGGWKACCMAPVVVTWTYYRQPPGRCS